MSKIELGCHPQKRSRYKVLNFEVDFLKTEFFSDRTKWFSGDDISAHKIIEVRMQWFLQVVK